MQASRDVDPGFLQGVQFSHQGRRIDDHAGTDHGVFAGAQNSAGDQLKDEFLSIEDHGVAGVMPSRASRDVIERRGKVVHYLALAFITPLCSHHHDRLHGQIAPAPVRIFIHGIERVEVSPATPDAGSATRLHSTPKLRILEEGSTKRGATMLPAVQIEGKAAREDFQPSATCICREIAVIPTEGRTPPVR